MDHLETVISRDLSHNQPPNADAIAYTSKILLKGPRCRGLANTEVDAHSQLLDGSQGPPMEELEKVPKELKGSATLYVEQQYELTSTPRSSCL